MFSLKTNECSFETSKNIAFIKLNLPEKFNVLSRETIEELSATCEIIAQTQNLRAVILIGELTNLNEEAKRTSKCRQRVCDLIENFPVPVIAAIDGIAAGGGFEIALACHLRIASDTAEFSLPETKLGLLSAYATQRLSRIIGEGRANELMIANKRITSNEALRIGLVNRVVHQSQLLNEAESLANEISKLAPLAVRALLTAVVQGADLPIADSLKLEAKLFSELFATEDMREGTSAFMEKRQPNFQGN